MLEFLAANGGLKPDGDLAAIFDGQKFVPGYGQLIRPNGQSLDRAFEAALSAGYFRDSSLDAGGPASLNFNDLLVAIERENAGHRLYAERDIPEMLDRQAKAEAAARRHEIDTAMERFFHEQGIDPATIDRRLWNRTRQMLLRGEQDEVDIAFERAVMEDSERYDRVSARRKEIVDDIPGWDFPDDRGPAPRPRGEDPARADPGAGREGETGPEPRAGGEPDRGSETTPAGEQLLVPGVSPVSQRARAEAAAQKALTGGDAVPPAGGLFDDVSRAQLDLMDSPALRRADASEIRNQVPLADDDGTVRLVARDALDQAGERPQLLADLVTACRV